VRDLTTGQILASFPIAGGDDLVAFSPDHTRLATAGSAGEIVIRDATSWQPVQEIHGHKGKIWCLSYSPDSKLLAAGGNDNAVYIWEVATGELLRQLPGSGYIVRALAFSPDGSVLAACCHRPFPQPASDVRVWDVRSGKLLKMLAAGTGGFHEHLVEDLAFSPDGRRLATASHDTTARIWNTADWTLQAVLKGHQDGIYGLDIAPDGLSLATASWDGTLQLWSLHSGLPLITLRDHPGVVYNVAFSHNGRMLASGSAHLPQGAPAVRQTTLFLAADEQDVRESQLARQMERNALKATFTADAPFLSGAWLPDGQHLAFVAETDRILVYQRPTGPESRDRQPVLKVGSNNARMITSNRRGQLATAGPSGPVSIHDVKTGKLIDSIDVSYTQILALAFSLDGRWLAAGSMDHMIRIWNMDQPGSVATLTGHAGPVCALAFSSDGTRLVSGSYDNSVRVWNVDQRQLVQTLSGHKRAVVSVAISADLRRIVGASSYQAPAILVWNLDQPDQPLRFTGPVGDIKVIGFVREGQLLVTGAWDGSIQFWDLDLGQQVGSWHSTDRYVPGFVLSPDGSELAMLTDRSVRIWDLAALLQVASPPRQPREPRILRSAGAL
jgi:WD40 repeat protein